MDNKITYTIEGNDIPFQLAQIPEPPKKLFVQGNLPKNNAKVLCIVGARKYSNYGESVTRMLISGLKGYNICIVSGLAVGIDGIAHRAALDAGLQTIAFPGSGLDPSVLYPRKHRRLAEEIIHTGGGLISEYEMTLPAFEWTFPRRNRLMAGISEATLVVEATKKSGSQITVRLAHDYNRTVGAVPGAITSPLSELPNKLIREGATPITCSKDILEMLGFDIDKTSPIQKELLLSLNDSERKIVELLQIEPLTIDMLIIKTKISIQSINEILSNMEISSIIKERSGRFYLS